jgi:predicted esterase
MIAAVRILVIVSLWAALLSHGQLPAQDDVADIKSQELRAGGDDNKRYFLIGPGADDAAARPPKGLILVLPGGDGSADFQPFVKRIYKNAVPEGYLVAQLVAPKWTETQKIVWPTEKSRAEGMKFTTEEFAEAVIKDVAGQHKIDPRRVFTLTWSSSGPAAYAISLTSKQVTGSLVAMSVFKPDQLPDLAAAKGHRYYLYHSPDDRVCPYRMAEQAAKSLEQNGATVMLTTYEGGHGWRGNVFRDIEAGIKWLAEHKANGREQ